MKIFSKLMLVVGVFAVAAVTLSACSTFSKADIEAEYKKGYDAGYSDGVAYASRPVYLSAGSTKRVELLPDHSTYLLYVKQGENWNFYEKGTWNINGSALNLIIMYQAAAETGESDVDDLPLANSIPASPIPVPFVKTATITNNSFTLTWDAGVNSFGSVLFTRQ